MEAANAPMAASVNFGLRRYLLDSLATGRSISVQCPDRKYAQEVWEIGADMGAEPTIRRDAKGWKVCISAGGGASHFNLYTLH